MNLLRGGGQGAYIIPPSMYSHAISTMTALPPGRGRPLIVGLGHLLPHLHLAVVSLPHQAAHRRIYIRYDGHSRNRA